MPHQDNSFLYTDPPTCTGLWLALEDATVTNGCLWAIPGSHKGNTNILCICILPLSCPFHYFDEAFLLFFLKAGLVRRFIRDETGVHFDKPSPSYDQKDFVPIEVKAGSLVVIHGDLIHQRSNGCLSSNEFLLGFFNIVSYLFVFCAWSTVLRTSLQHLDMHTASTW